MITTPDLIDIKLNSMLCYKINLWRFLGITGFIGFLTFIIVYTIMHFNFNIAGIILGLILILIILPGLIIWIVYLSNDLLKKVWFDSNTNDELIIIKRFGKLNIYKKDDIKFVESYFDNGNGATGTFGYWNIFKCLKIHIKNGDTLTLTNLMAKIEKLIDLVSSKNRQINFINKTRYFPIPR